MLAVTDVGFAVLGYRTENIGDDIQALAARRLLPDEACTVDRDTGEVQCLTPDEHRRHRVVANGWYALEPGSWPWRDELQPLLVSMHLSPNPNNALRLSARTWFLKPELRAYLELHGPVGARDRETLHHLEKAGVPSYLSGCLTLTLPEFRGERVPRTVLVDVPEDVVLALRDALQGEVVEVTHAVPVTMSDAARRRRAAELIELYATSHLVVTTRLHAALPTVAAATPVVLVDDGQRDGRFAGLDDFLRVVSPRTADVDWPTVVAAAAAEPVQRGHATMRDALLGEVAQWVGRDGGQPAEDWAARRAAAALAEVRERGRLLEDLRAQLGDVAHREGKHEVALDEARRQVERLQAFVERRRSEFVKAQAQWQEERAETAAQLRGLRDELQRERAEQVALERELGAVRASTSWRITAPMRRARDAARRP